MFETVIASTQLKFYTDKTSFSPDSIDRGTLAMLSTITFSENDFVLDLGCGYGVVGILAAKIIGEDKVVMCDLSQKAVELSAKNAEENNVSGVKIYQSNAYENITESNFTLILSNPPYHADFSVPKEFIEKGFKKLSVGGKMIMVTKRLDWYKNKLKSIFGGVKVQEIDDYFIFTAEKRSETIPKKQKSKNGLSKKLSRKYKEKPCQELKNL